MRFEFVSLRDRPELFSIIKKTFEERIKPVYGDQTQALLKIKEGTDRTCEILFALSKAVGMIVYKNELT